MKTLFGILFLALVFSFSRLSGQAIDASDRFYRLLQKNTDSVLVFGYSGGGWMPDPHLRMIVKRGHRLACYQYRDIGLLNARGSADSTGAGSKFIFRLPKDLRKHLTVVPMDKDSLRAFWRALNTTPIWTVSDDTSDGYGCPVQKGKDKVVVSDGSGYSLLRISGKELKVLSFSDPAFFEGLCPGRTGRVAIVKVAGLFDRYF